MTMLEKINNISENFKPHKDKKCIPEKKKIERDHRDFVDKSLNTRSRIKDGLSRLIFQNELFVSELSFLLREVKFSKENSSTNKPISNIKYYHLSSQM